MPLHPTAVVSAPLISYLKKETLLTMAAIATIVPARIVIASIMRVGFEGYTK